MPAESISIISVVDSPPGITSASIDATSVGMFGIPPQTCDIEIWEITAPSGATLVANDALVSTAWSTMDVGISTNTTQDVGGAASFLGGLPRERPTFWLEFRRQAARGSA